MERTGRNTKVLKIHSKQTKSKYYNYLGINKGILRLIKMKERRNTNTQ